jgi:uncharacterized protein YkwD
MTQPISKKIAKILLALALLLLVFKGVANASSLIFPEKSSPASYGSSAEEILNLTNLYRQNLGLNPLNTNPRLTQAALNKAQSILKEQYFSHTSPSGKKFSEWINEVSYKYFYVGENLAIDFSNPQNAFDAWLKSPKHKENIVRPEFQEIGIAYLHGKFNGRETAVVVQLFGSRVLGVNELTTNNNYPSTAANYFSQSSDNLKIDMTTLNYYTDLGLLLLIALTVLFYFRREPLAFNANTASPTRLKQELSDNMQRYSMNGDSNISTTNQWPSNQTRKPRKYQPAIEANQMHRR